ncbi:hypothetical protein [Brevibacillus daliensis]|nr:hypothetical protein [Brevibacillus daliensis]
MKKFLAITFAVAMIMSVAGAANAANVQPDCMLGPSLCSLIK